MPTPNIKTKFVLEGEQEYKRAMRDAADAIKVLNSEEKLAKAQFEQTGDAQKYASEQSRILREKIEAQTGAVHAAEQAMKSLADQGVSKNDKTYQTWQTRLNNAKTTLTQLESQLGKTEGGFEDVNTAAENTDSKLDSIDKEVRFQNTLKILEDMRDRLNGIVRGAAKAAKAIWDMETDAGQWADDLSTAASNAGLDVETYQSWQYASRLIDTSVDDIGKSVRKVEADLKASTDDVLKTFNELGVVTRNADGSVRDATDVFFDTVDALGRVEDATKRGIYAQTLLGSHYNTLNPLIEAGSKAYKETAEEGMKVAVVSEENVKKLAALNDQQEKMDAALEKTKMTLLSSLAEPFEKVAAGITNATTALSDFLESEEGQAALAALTESMDGLIESFLGEDNGKGTFQSIVEGATGAVNAFTGALKWIKDNQGTVKAALIGFGTVWGMLNVAPPVLEALHLIQRITGNKSGGITGGSGADTVSGAAAGNDAIQAASGGFKSKLATLGKNAAAAVARATVFAEELGLLWAGAESTVNMAKEIQDQGTLLGTGSGNTDENGWWQLGQSGIYLNVPGIKDFFTPKYEEKGPSGYDLYNEIKSAVENGMNASAYTAEKYNNGELGKLYQTIMDDLNSGIENGLIQKGDDLYMNAIDQLIKSLEEMANAAKDKGTDAAESVKQGIEEKTPDVQQAATDMAQTVTEETEEEMSFLDAVGATGAQNFADGIRSKRAEAESAAWEVANSVQSIINAAMARVSDSVAGMTGLASAAPVYRSSGSWGADPSAQSAGAGGSVNATIVMDKTTVGRMVAPIVNETIGAAVASARRG